MYKQGDIIFMPFPNDDFIGAKNRPAIIISKNKSKVGSYVVAKITSVLRNDSQCLALLSTDISLSLQRPSEVRCDCLMTIAEYIIIKKFGELKSSALKNLCEQIKTNFDTP
jgi:mRNA-degrading endonuclease toxin of MazEF toxin-antitoxin module